MNMQRYFAHTLMESARVSLFLQLSIEMFFRTDRLFIEAAQNPRHCDRLLKRLKRDRIFLWIVLIVVGCAALGCLAWELHRFSQYLDTIVSTPLSDLGKHSKVSLSWAGYVGIGLSFQLFLDFAVLHHNDACIKMLLILREQQAQPPNAPRAGDSREA